MSVPFQQTLVPELESIGALADQFEAWAETVELPMKLVMEMNLIFDELITNIVTHGFIDTTPQPISIAVNVVEGELLVELIDKGHPFNLLEATAPDVGASIEDREIGGLGIHFVKKIADRIAYRRDAGCNVVTLAKRVSPQRSTSPG